jgi:hypothetical protein
MQPLDKKRYLTELKYRIEAEVTFHKGSMPENIVILWSGYLAGILETSVISFDEYLALDSLLPKVENNPVYDLFMDRHEEDEGDDPKD